MGFCPSLTSHDIFEIKIKCEFLVPHEIKNNIKLKVKTEKKKKKKYKEKIEEKGETFSCVQENCLHHWNKQGAIKW